MSCITVLIDSGNDRLRPNAGPYVERGGEYKGYEWLVVLNDIGHRCGYVAIPEGHPLYDNEHAAESLEVHGGVTFFDKQMTESECDDKWIGFDCGHIHDACDIGALRARGLDVSYHEKRAALDKELQELLGEVEIRTASYVESECRKMIDQIEIITSRRNNALVR